jgi:uncharacterized membrane protein (DUF485 family)
MSSTSDPSNGEGASGADRLVAVHSSPEFEQLRRTFRGWVFPMTAAFLVWYFLFVLLSVYAHGFMSHSVIGNVHVGLVFGVLQFLSTFAITMAYVRWAGTKLDPEADRLRAVIESGEAVR